MLSTCTTNFLGVLSYSVVFNSWKNWKWDPKKVPTCTLENQLMLNIGAASTICKPFPLRNAQYFPSSMLLPQRGIEFLGCQWSELAYTQGHQVFFLLGRVERCWIFWNLFLFLLCSHRKCPLCSPTCVQYTCHQCYPLGTYIGGWLLGPMCFYVWSEYFYNVDSWKFQIFFVMGQLKRLLAKK